MSHAYTLLSIAGHQATDGHIKITETDPLTGLSAFCTPNKQ